MTPPQAFYGMLGTGVYQQQYVAFRPGRAPNACAVGPEPSVMLAGAAAAIPRGQHDGWADVYGPTGLQSPALTDAYYDMSSPLAPAHQAMLAAYGPSHAPS
ncbi:hypothetical protein CDD83_3281 [Cordyceps sp. RAO-2017]|nr:hypothetical protein CDD83_3281 [Cordyceps sp. RAO-2017]